jgi:lysyl endopeptidase
MRLYILLLIVVCLGSTSLLKAQLSFGGRPFCAAVKSDTTNEVPYITMPAFTEDDMAADGRLLKSYRFAHPFFVDITPENSGKWQLLADGTKVWRVGIRSAKAYSLNLIFDKFDLPTGAKVFLYTPSQSVVAGAFTNQSHTSEGAFATLPIPGDDVVVEYSQGPDVEGSPKLQIAAVNHDYKNLFGPSSLKVGNFGDSDTCHMDISCINGSYPEEKAVVRMIVDGTEVCSGTLLNNTNKDGTPYYITASHCLRSELTNHSFLFLFNYQVPNCQTHIEGYKAQSLSGANIVANIGNMDCLLVKGNQIPPPGYRPYWAGWSLATSFQPPFHAIHHPWGDVKKFARSTTNIVPATYPEVPNPFDDNAHWMVQQWRTGTTERGSSGCALFNAEGRFIGGLSGGYATCGDPIMDYFFKFYQAWQYDSTPLGQLKSWLDANNTNAVATNGFDFYAPYTVQRISNFEEGDSAVYTQNINGNSIRWMGNNTQNIDAIAEKFETIKSCTLEGIYLHLGKTATTGSINIKVYSEKYFSENDAPVLDTTVNLSTFKAPSENLVVLNKKLDLLAPVSISVTIPDANFALFHQHNPAGRAANTAYLRKDGSWQAFNQVHANGEKSSAFIDLLASYVTLNDSNIIDEPGTKIDVYPNPSNDKVYFKWGIDPLKRLEIVSLNGQLLSAQNYGYTYGDEWADVNNLPYGIYLFRFIFGKATVVHKIIVTH